MYEGEDDTAALFASAGEGVCGLDEAGRCVFVDDVGLQILGVADDADLIGWRFGEVLRHSEVCAGLEGGRECELCRALRAGTPGGRYEVDVTRSDGDRFRAECRAYFVPPSRSGVRTLVMFSNATDRGRLREQVRHACRVEAVGRLASGIAHDFNNLLTTIIGYAEVTRELVADNPEAVMQTRRIEEAAEQAAELTRTLLTFTRQTAAEQRPVDAREVISRCARLLGRILPATFELTVDLPESVELWVHGDPVQLQQVLLNLAVEVRETLGEHGRLGIAACVAGAPRTTDASAECVAISVFGSDAGQASAMSMAGTLDGHYTNAPALGLGLATVERVVHELGGTLQVERAGGRVERYALLLPRLAAEAAALEVQQTAAPRGTGELILLAEDDWHVRSIVTQSLRSKDYEVAWAEDGEAFLECFAQRAEAVGLFVVDVDLPKRNGLSCLQAIRARGCVRPAIVITGSVDVDLEDQLDEHTILLRKPFQIGELCDVIGRMLAAGGTREPEREAEDLTAAG